MRGKRMTIEEFRENVKKYGNAPDIEILEFDKVNSPCKIYCKICNKEFIIPRANRLYKYRCCPDCRIEGNFTNYGTKQTIHECNRYMFDMLLNKEDGFKYCQTSAYNLEWVCPFCGNIIKARCSNVYYRGLSCKYCGDGISYPNKFVGNLLLQLGVDFIPEKTFGWSKFEDRKYYRYDFYVESKNMIIEVMGEQHYPENHSSFGDYDSIHIIDVCKEKLAFKNNISFYLKIDARESELKFMKHSCISELSGFYNLDKINWKEIEKMSRSSLLIDCKNEFNNEKSFTTQDIADKFGIDRETVVKYLKRATILGLCNYTKEVGLKRGKRKSAANNSKRVPVCKISKSGDIIKKYKSIKEAESENNCYNICRCLKISTLTSGGYFWKRINS